MKKHFFLFIFLFVATFSILAQVKEGYNNPYWTEIVTEQPEGYVVLENGDVEQVARNVRNDLAPALWRKFPVLTLIRNELTARGALAVEVSGSGPALFAVMPELSSARGAAADLEKKFPRWRSFAVEVLQ